MLNGSYSRSSTACSPTPRSHATPAEEHSRGDNKSWGMDTEREDGRKRRRFKAAQEEGDEWTWKTELPTDEWRRRGTGGGVATDGRGEERADNQYFFSGRARLSSLCEYLISNLFACLVPTGGVSLSNAIYLTRPREPYFTYSYQW